VDENEGKWAIESEAMTRYRLDLVESVTPGYIKEFKIDQYSVVLVAGDSEVVAIENRCPHAASPLDSGRVMGNRLRCPRHGYIFDLETGLCARGRREGFGGLKFLHLVEEDGYYAVEL